MESAMIRGFMWRRVYCKYFSGDEENDAQIVAPHYCPETK
jgi:hypothetical protein